MCVKKIGRDSSEDSFRRYGWKVGDLARVHDMDIIPIEVMIQMFVDNAFQDFRVSCKIRFIYLLIFWQKIIYLCKVNLKHINWWMICIGVAIL